jgi:hypothetical protein
MDMTAKRISLWPAPLNSEGQGTVFNWGALCLPVRAPVCVRTRTGRRRQVPLWFKNNVQDSRPDPSTLRNESLPAALCVSCPLSENKD